MAQANLTTRIKANVNGMAKSGATTLALIAECIEHIDLHGDGSKLALLVSLLPSGDAKRVKSIASAAAGITFKASKKAAEGMVACKPKFTNVADMEAADKRHVLSAYIERGVSFRSDALSSPIGNLPALLVPKDKAAFDLFARLNNLYDAAVENGHSMDDIEQALHVIRIERELPLGDAA